MKTDKKKQRAKDKRRQQNINKSKQRQQKPEQPKDLQQEIEQPKDTQQELEQPEDLQQKLKNEEQQKLDAEKLQQELQELLKKIRKIADNGNYIFRGENKIHYQISSKLRRYFQSIVGHALLQEGNVVIDFSPIKKILESQLEKQLTESAQKIDFSVIEKSLKRSVLAELAQRVNYPLSVEGVQNELILKDVQEHAGFENEIDTLAELQHFGGSTNRIDFSYDLAIALFFACDGEPEENGRLILLRADDEGVIAPKKNQNNRIVFQKSVFVKRDEGYIEKNEVEQIIVSKDIKPLILTYVQNYFDIRTETIYGDLMGYIQNQERHSEAYKKFFAGLISYRGGFFEKAAEHYEKAIDLKPNFADAYNNRGVVYNKEGDHVRARKCINKAIELNPNYAEAYLNRGISYDAKGEHDRAFDDYNKAITLNLNEAVVYCNRGVIYSEKEKYDLAIADYDKAIDINPNYVDAYINRGVVYSSKGYYDDALANFKKAIALNPNIAVTYNNRGVTYNSKANYDLAMVDLNKAIELNPSYADAYHNRGISKGGLKNYKEAKEDYETAIRLAEEQDNKLLAARAKDAIDILLTNWINDPQSAAPPNRN